MDYKHLAILQKSTFLEFIASWYSDKNEAQLNAQCFSISVTILTCVHFPHAFNRQQLWLLFWPPLCTSLLPSSVPVGCPPCPQLLRGQGSVQPCFGEFQQSHVQVGIRQHPWQRNTAQHLNSDRAAFQMKRVVCCHESPEVAKKDNGHRECGNEQWEFGQHNSGSSFQFNSFDKGKYSKTPKI